MEQTLRFRLSLDGAQQVQSGAAAAAQGLGQLGQAAAHANVQTRVTGQQSAQLSAQLQDLFVQIQAGGNPLTALIQQGSQLSAVFGGVGNAVKAVGSLVTPAVVGIGALAAGIGGLALAYKQGSAEGDAYAKSLILTGNAAGTTAGHLQAMARALAGTVGTQGKAAEVIAQLASSGRVAASEIGRLAEATVRFERSGGAAVAETTKKFAELGRAPLQTLVKLNEAEGFLTATLYSQVKALQEQGRTAEAAAKAQAGYAEVVTQRSGQLEARLGTLERGWRAVGDAAKYAWDAAANVGRPGNAESAVDAAESRLRTIRRTVEQQRSFGRQPTAKDVVDLDRGERELAIAKAVARALQDSETYRAANVEQSRALAESDQLVEQSLSNQVKLAKQLEAARTTMQVAGKSPQEIEQTLAYIKATSAAGQQAFQTTVARINAAVSQAALGLRGAQAELDAQAQLGFVRQQDFIERSAALREQDLRNQIDALRKLRAATAAQPNSGPAVAQIDLDLEAKSIELGQARKKTALELATAKALETRAVRDAMLALREEGELQINQQLDQQQQQRNQVLRSVEDYKVAIDESVRAQQFELQLMFATDAQRAVAIEQYRIELDLRRRIREIQAAPFESEDARQFEISKVTEAANRAKVAAAGKVYVDEFKRVNAQIAENLTDSLLGAIHAGRDGVKQFGDDLVRMFERMVLRPTIQAVFQQAGGLVAALAGGGSADGGGGGGNWLSSLSSGSSLYSTAVSWLGGAGASAATAQAAATSGGWSAGMLQGYGGTAASAGSSAASAIPIIGWIIAALIASNAAYKGGNTVDMLDDRNRDMLGVGLLETHKYDTLSQLGFSDKWAQILSGAPIAARLFGHKASVSGFGYGGVQGGDFLQSTQSPLQFGANTLGGGADVGLQDFAANIAAAVGLAAGTFGGALQDGLRVGAFTDADREGKSSSLLGYFNASNRLISGTQTGSGAFGAGGPGVAAEKIDSKDLTAWFDEQMPLLIVQGLQQSDLTARFKSYFDSVGQGSALSSEKAQELLQTATAVQQLTLAFTPLGGVFKQFETTSVESLAAIAKSAGGFDQLGQSVTSYYQAFYTESERTKIASDGIAKALAGVGLAMPDLTQSADQARAEFRSLVDGIADIGSESGQKTLNTLLGVASAFDQLVGAADQAQQAARQQADSEAQGLSTRLLQAQGRTVELRERERQALDPLNRALFDQVVAAEDAAQALQQRLSLETRLLQLQGNTVELRNRERLALDATNRALYDQVTALEDLKSLTDLLRTAADQAMQAVERSVDAQKNALQSAYNAQIKLLDAQAKAVNTAYDTVAKQVSTQRKAAQELYDSQAGAINEQLKALEAAEKQRGKEYRSAVDQVAAERKAAIDTYAAAADQLQAVIRASSESVTRLTGLNDALKSTLSGLRPAGSEAADRARGQSQIAAALAIARTTGALPTADSLKDALSAISRPSEDLFGSFVAYQRDFFRTAIDIGDLQKISGAQLGEAQSQLDATLAMKDSLDQGNEANLERLDGIREALDLGNDQAREAYDARRDELQSQLDAARAVYDQSIGSLDGMLAAAEEARAQAIAAIDAQREGLTVQLEADLSALDGILDYARRQYEEVVGINNTIQTVPESITALGTALQSLAAAIGQGPITTGGGPTGTGTGTGNTSTTQTGSWVTSGNVQTWLDPNGAVAVQPVGNTSTGGVVLRGADGQVLNAQQAMDYINANVASPTTLLAATTQFGISDQGVDALMGWTAGTFAAITTGAALKGIAPADIKAYTLDRIAAGDMASIYQRAVQYSINSLSLDAITGLTRGTLGSAARSAGLPSFAVGTPYVPRDMVAQIHQGERIIPATDNADLMRMLQQGVTDEAFASVVAELREVRRELAMLKDAGLATAANTGKSSRLLDRWDGDGQPPTRTDG